MSAKCPCQNCNVNIEFEPDQAGQTVACPKCGMDTLLFIPPAQSPPAAMPEPAKPASNWKYPPKTKSEPVSMRLGTLAPGPAPWWAPWWASRQYRNEIQTKRALTPLEGVRSATAFRYGRRLATGFCILSAAGTSIAGAIYCNLDIQAKLLAASTGRLSSGLDGEIQMALWITLGGLVVFVSSILIRQALIALFDIADCALKSQRISN